MKTHLSVAVAIVLIAAIAFVAGTRWESTQTAEPTTASDGLWYHASDVAQLARTGRPQLVEFFHPG